MPKFGQLASRNDFMATFHTFASSTNSSRYAARSCDSLSGHFRFFQFSTSIDFNMMNLHLFKQRFKTIIQSRENMPKNREKKPKNLQKTPKIRKKSRKIVKISRKDGKKMSKIHEKSRNLAKKSQKIVKKAEKS